MIFLFLGGGRGNTSSSQRGNNATDSRDRDPERGAGYQPPNMNQQSGNTNIGGGSS